MRIQANEPESGGQSFWLARTTRTIFFFALMLTAAGVYLAFKVPISVFPETSFPRVIIAVDNGVMPVEQMEVTITRPIEAAVNSVPGLETVRSTTSRGSAEVSLFFNWNVDMVTELQLVDASLSMVQQTLPSTVHISTKRLTFASFPILGYSLTSDTVPLTRLWEIATGRQHRAGAGRQGARVSCSPESRPDAECGRDRTRLGARNRGFEYR
jgi:multidrug efflux pump subunit AcrB